MYSDGKDSMRQIPSHTISSPSDDDEQALQQQTIRVWDEEFTVVLAPDNQLYMNLPAICVSLGVNARAQIRRIQRTDELLPGLRQLVIETRGGRQRINCLQVDLIGAWLKGIQADVILSKLQLKLEVYHRELAIAARAAFPALQEHVPDPLESTAIDMPGTTSLIHEERRPETLALIANIPANAAASHLVVTSFPEDTAFRESAFAKGERWILGGGAPHYKASNQIQVYLGHPSLLLDLSEALKRIGELGESTVLTARIAVGLWTTRRLDSRLSENGSAAIGLEEILEWRGIQKHSRPAYPGSHARITDGYEVKHKRQVYRDFFLLQQCHLRGEYNVVDQQSGVRSILIEGPYLRVSVVMERTLWNDREVIGFLVSPGDWFNAYPGPAFDYFALIDRRIFQLHAWQDQLAIRIGLYLVERWRQQAVKGNFDGPIAMGELLKASMIEIDEPNLTSRFAGRVEAALYKLYDRKVLGEEPHCLTIIDKTRNWGQAWLKSLWRLLPHLEVQEFYRQPERMRLAIEGERADRRRGRKTGSRPQTL